MPVIGFFHSASPGGYAFYVTTFRNGLKEAGYIEGRNVAVECPRAEGQLAKGFALDIPIAVGRPDAKMTSIILVKRYSPGAGHELLL